MRSLFRGLTVASMLSASLALHAQQDKERELTVKDLPYGVALYNLYQNRHLNAITEIDVGEFKGQLARQPEDAELLKGGLYFSYGLSDDAERIFNELLERKTDLPTQNRIWFGLAQIQFERGNREAGGKLLARIQGKLPQPYEDQRQYLLSSLNIDKDQFGQAARHSDRISGNNIWKAYTQYNLGIALKQNWQGSKDWLARVDKTARFLPRDEEMQALADQANLALGLYSMEKRDVNSAIAYISRVRSSGPLSNKALLATGWAYSRLNRPDRALAFWNTLRNKSHSDDASQEALLAIPQAYEQKGNLELSALFYDQAANRFDQLLLEIDDGIQAIEDGEFISALRENRARQKSRATDRPQTLPRTAATVYLLPELSKRPMQTEIRRFDELLDIQEGLAQWKNDLPALQLMLEERKKAFANKRPQLKEFTGFDRLQQIQRRRDALAAEVKRIEAREDSLALATEREREYLDILDDVKARIKRLSGKRDMSDDRERHRLFRGLLQFQLATEFPKRMWQLKRDLQLLDRALEQAQTSARSLQQASGNNAANLDRYQQRIKRQYAETTRLEDKVATLIARQEQHLSKLAAAAMRERRQRITRLRLNARYSLVRLYDEIMVKQAARR